MLHVPEDGCTAKTSGYAEMGVRFWKRGQEATAAAAILPGDQMTAVSDGKVVGV